MYNNHLILAIIPARGGSKGLSRKNVLPLSGMPLIAWTVLAAKKSRYIDKVIVTTDDQEIADVAKEFGAEVPFIRPTHLASDGARGMDVLIHAMEQSSEIYGKYSLVSYLQPTSPLRTSEDIDQAIEFFFDKNAKSVVSVCKAEHPPFVVNVLQKDLSLNGFIGNTFDNKNRQECGEYFQINGAIYLADWEYILTRKSWYQEDSYAYIMSQEKSVDIDTAHDFFIVECLLKKEIGRYI